MKRLRPPHQDSLPTRAALYADFFNEIGAKRTHRSRSVMSMPLISSACDLASRIAGKAQTEPKSVGEWRVMRSIGRRHHGAPSD
jgi:hypothetical protein